MSELKSCPFCGQRAIELINRQHYHEENHWKYIVQCLNEECTATVGPFNPRDKAIKAWNNRPVKGVIECLKIT